MVRRPKQMLLLTLLFVSLCAPRVFAVSHYLADPGDGHHYAWSDQNPGTPRVDVYYDFRPTINGASNSITPSQQGVVAQALSLWSHAGNVGFIRNEYAPNDSIINIGVGYIDGPWQTVGRGGAYFQHSNAWGIHSIRGGIAMLDVENWDLSIGNGNPARTIDFFTVAAHEIGHTLGLGHTDDLTGIDLMDSVYGGELTRLSNNDIALLQTLYGPPGGNGRPRLVQSTFSERHVHEGGLVMAPEPSSFVMLASGLTGIGVWRARRRKQA